MYFFVQIAKKVRGRSGLRQAKIDEATQCKAGRLFSLPRCSCHDLAAPREAARLVGCVHLGVHRLEGRLDSFELRFVRAHPPPPIAGAAPAEKKRRKRITISRRARRGAQLHKEAMQVCRVSALATRWRGRLFEPTPWCALCESIADAKPSEQPPSRCRADDHGEESLPRKPFRLHHLRRERRGGDWCPWEGRFWRRRRRRGGRRRKGRERLRKEKRRKWLPKQPQGVSGTTNKAQHVAPDAVVSVSMSRMTW